MIVNPGELNKRIEIINEVTAKDGDGYDVVSEELIRAPWAKFTRTSGTETAKANADFGEIKVRFLVRYSSTKITRKMKVRYNNDLYNIIFVKDYEDSHEYIEIWCDIVGLN